ncbi:agamous-like MADS-box protein AGL36 [Pyrus ussuriensis x Pyrus communis]|uniref:Agamous-like MADS-box protein AGL36 n=1 Tax=Pyrus ussuriensis x Pyrus communis TaxID=2448454 RepID=A0A5N5GB94_9ROSA|nr:agamous-like MADS-box protein AGL36 [Pyrus ussuriensis x Pyrus communis]
MGKKVKLAWVENDRARKDCFRKRKANLLRKMEEITTLCQVNAFAIVYGQDNNDPTLWPTHPEVEELIKRFFSIPNVKRYKKSLNQETYLLERAVKFRERIKKINKQIREMKGNKLMHQVHEGKSLNEFERSDMTDLVSFCKEKMYGIKKLVAHLEKEDLNSEQGTSNYEKGKDIENTAGNIAANGIENSGDALGLGLMSHSGTGKEVGQPDVSHEMVKQSENVTGKKGERIRLMGVAIEVSSVADDDDAEDPLQHGN